MSFNSYFDELNYNTPGPDDIKNCCFFDGEDCSSSGKNGFCEQKFCEQGGSITCYADDTDCKKCCSDKHAQNCHNDPTPTDTYYSCDGDPYDEKNKRRCVVDHSCDQYSENCYNNDKNCNNKCSSTPAPPDTPTYYSCNSNSCEVNKDCTPDNNNDCYTTSNCNNQCSSTTTYYGCNPDSKSCEVNKFCKKSDEDNNCYTTSDCGGTCTKTPTVQKYKCDTGYCQKTECTDGTPNCYTTSNCSKDGKSNCTQISDKYSCKGDGKCEIDNDCTIGNNCYPNDKNCRTLCSPPKVDTNPSSFSTTNSSNVKGLSTGETIGIISGSFFFLIALFIIIMYIKKKK